ncbi:MAG: 4-hydroxybenzoyl-CoA reductase [bacterium]|nr:4-hydroxybenzoyl-CoA reductase [bacterium]
MMRLPRFLYRVPTSLDEAAKILAGEGPQAMLLAGGTDLLPNMKRRQQVPRTLVALRGVEELRRTSNGKGLRLGAGLTLTDVVRSDIAREAYPGLWKAAAQVATPHLRNMATLGGNLCLDTRCTYYDQNYEWRKAIGFCMKKDGETCWVAPSSSRCLAVSSTDTAPALISLGARVRLVGADGEREVAVADLYRNDGIEYIARKPGEILAEVLLDDADGWRSTYWKLRRRGAFDFPVLSVAAALKLAADGTVQQARVVLGAVASQPMLSADAAERLVGDKLTDGAIADAASAAIKLAKPMDNTDFTLHWRKRVASEFVGYALRELRGDDVTELRSRLCRTSF